MSHQDTGWLCYCLVNPHQLNQMCETFYLVHALWYEFALTVDACERAVSGHLLQSIRNIAWRRRATIGWMRTWRRSKRATNTLCTFIIWTEWSQVDEGVGLKSKRFVTSTQMESHFRRRVSHYIFIKYNEEIFSFKEKSFNELCTMRPRVCI